ncbi:DNA-directed RNA polymerase, subunit D [Archaeoglobus sulfaticallidus PM70-1]|uniref:DNA-directed RNA polymerase subunit Rpo3 n=1 Tax=Archaeoglobus sulfaticallidus PM70-1 TaxID=387631 RepID=N0BAK5_9EURY|nr:DNA-directed RNA polymerase subunit D [Archaeoglobus sulfaticallidus]AGK60644.1 DNA-directed RNA polymerase, subunit D [Archaeoglobus sulfaticallidus PM70-1]
MKIRILEEDEFRIKFILKSSTAFANSLRRAMKSLVPTLAVDYVDFYLNTSYLYDEILAHRIGLIPIKTDLQRFNFQDKCVCGGEGCPNCQVSLRLNIEGPKVVYSGDFISEDPEIVPVFDNIPVVELDKGQQIMIEAVARLGTGKEHVKWQPVSLCGYRIVPEINITENCKLCMECIDACPRNVFSVVEGKLSAENVLECSMCMECVNVCEENAIEIKETNNFLFIAEGTGALPVRTVLEEALKIIKRKAEEMNTILEIAL